MIRSRLARTVCEWYSKLARKLPDHSGDVSARCIRRVPLKDWQDPVAQWIEHLPSKQRVAGSSPAGIASKISTLIEEMKCSRFTVH
jgi:hypothetical protein